MDGKQTLICPFLRYGITNHSRDMEGGGVGGVAQKLLLGACIITLGLSPVQSTVCCCNPVSMVIYSQYFLFYSSSAHLKKKKKNTFGTGLVSVKKANL